MDLKEKLKQEIRSKKQSQIDWKKRKKDWISSINKLHQLIENWFSDFKIEGLVKFKKTEKTLNEEYIGSYNVNVLHLVFANGKEIIVEPMGTLVIGAWARFDIYARGYNSGKYYILRFMDDEENFSWNLTNPENTRTQRQLTKEELEKIFEKWLT